MTVWRIGSCELDSERSELRRDGVVVAAQPRLLKVLTELAKDTDRVVLRSELTERAWEGTSASEATVRDAVKNARKLLGADRGALRSVRGCGYQLRAQMAAEVSASAWASARVERIALPAKICEPEIDEAIPRARLFEQLDAALGKRAIWVTGRAGAGKTTLVRSFLEARGLPRIWYRLDDGDADPGRVFHYLARAVAALGVRADEDRLASYSADAPSRLTAFARRYFEALYAALPRPCAMVFDDCHEVAFATPWQAIARQAVSCAAPDVHVVFVSRTAPYTTLARYLTTGEMDLVGGQDLRLTIDEARQLVATECPLLDRAAAGELWSITKGWAAGFALLLDEARRSRCVEPIALLERTLPAIFDYFESEVFERLAPEERELLLRTAILPKMTAELAQEVTRTDSADRLLDGLCRQNAFVERNDERPLVYRCHPLLRRFLRDRAQRLSERRSRVSRDSFVLELVAGPDAPSMSATAGGEKRRRPLGGG